MKLLCVSFSSHGLHSLKHPACIQPGIRTVAEGHTYTESFESQGWHREWARNTMWVQSWSLSSEEMWAGDWALPFRD